jgi:TetR/AcrR family transcriptional regulator, transcriptional repressor for nem operon
MFRSPGVARSLASAYFDDDDHHSMMTMVMIVKRRAGPAFWKAAMRISKEAAAANKARVVEAAARMLREKGFEGLGVAEVMKEAGFTHGGFYNHFGSKDDLAAAALRSAFDSSVARVAARAAEAGTKKRRRDAFRHYVDRYLARATRDAPGRSCPMASLGTDAARHGEALKAQFADGVARYLEAFAGVVPDAGGADTRQTAIEVISTLIGALTLSRACAGADDALSEEILSVVRERLLNGAS